MTRIWLAVPIALAICTSDSRAEPSSHREPGSAVLKALKIATDANEQGDSGGVIAALGPFVQPVRYSGLDTGMRYRVDEMFGAAAYSEGLYKAAHDSFVRTSSSPEATVTDWRLRLASATYSGDFADAFAAFQKFRTLSPGDLPVLEDDVVLALDQGLDTLPDNGEASFQFEDALLQAGWPPNVYGHAEEIRYHYAVRLMERPLLAEKRSVAWYLAGPHVMSVALADKRLDPVIALSPEIGNGDPAARIDPPAILRRAMQEELDTRSEIVRSHPNAQFANAELATTLLWYGRYAEALQTATKAFIGPPPATEVEFYDQANGERISSWVQVQSLLRLGRPQEALTLRSNLDGVHLAELLVSTERWSDAADVLGSMPDNEQQTPEERQLLAAFRLCVVQHAHDERAARATRAFLDAHPFSNVRYTLYGLACQGDREGAVGYAIRLIQDPRHRQLILQELQDFAPLPNPTPGEARLESLRRELRQDPRVLEALAPVGRVNHFDLPYTGETY